MEPNDEPGITNHAWRASRERVALNRNGSAGVIVLLVLGALLIVAASAYATPEDFWTIAAPGILTGIGTLGLAGTTVWFSLREVARDEVLRREQREQFDTQSAAAEMRYAAEQAARTLAARRAQAAGVAVWVGQCAVADLVSVDRPLITGSGVLPAVILFNQSDLPIWDLHLRLCGREDQAPSYMDKRSTVVPPATRSGWRVDDESERRSRPGGLGWEEIHARVTFLDAAGIRWERTSNGTLAELDI